MLDKFQLNFNRLVKEKNFSPDVLKIKKLNFDNFLKNGFPSKKLEDWKFLDFNQILKSEFESLDSVSEKVDIQKEFFKIVKEFDHNQVFLLDGVFFKSNFEFDDAEKIKISDDLYFDKKINQNSLVNLNHSFVGKRMI